ncbi:hypothetical protein VMCG_06252 [Cytospora schulzeri]|uniref:Uncharacterized protein n=1 Tax=Cytospora schulzeri TaxID=448051 RepID=A0A423W9C2_9PEZI|nr:hypothetical protein VMCG_06252 [Valsa malicola]
MPLTPPPTSSPRPNSHKYSGRRRRPGPDFEEDGSSDEEYSGDSEDTEEEDSEEDTRRTANLKALDYSADIIRYSDRYISTILRGRIRPRRRQLFRPPFAATATTQTATSPQETAQPTITTSTVCQTTETTYSKRIVDLLLILLVLIIILITISSSRTMEAPSASSSGRSRTIHLLAVVPRAASRNIAPSSKVDNDEAEEDDYDLDDDDDDDDDGDDTEVDGVMPVVTGPAQPAKSLVAGGKKAKLAVELKLNLEIEIQLKVHIQGDLTLELL